MTVPQSEKIWHDGEFVDWDDAKIHVMSHALHYGTSWFEGIRCYETSRGSEVFRLNDHVTRLMNSCRIFRTESPFSHEEICAAILETIRVNELKHCYIRPIIFRGYGSYGVNPLKAPVKTYVVVYEWGRYLGDEAMEAGIDAGVATWTRMAPNTVPFMAKTAGNYINSALIKMEAQINGFAEGIALDTQGYVSEGSGENIFLLYKGKLLTPPLSNCILPGITRDTVIVLAGELDLEVQEQLVPRELLYLADEIFMCGTAAEMTPVRSVDHVVVGTGKRGPVTARLQGLFFDYVEGKVDDRHGWMSPVYTEERIQSS